MSGNGAPETMRLFSVGPASASRIVPRKLLGNERFRFIEAASPAAMPDDVGASDIVLTDSAWLARLSPAEWHAFQACTANAAALVVSGNANMKDDPLRCRRVLWAPADDVAVAQLLEGIRDDVLGKPLPVALVADPTGIGMERRQEVKAAHCTPLILSPTELVQMSDAEACVALIVDVAPGETGLVAAARRVAGRLRLPLILLASAGFWSTQSQTSMDDEFWLNVPAVAGQLAALLRPIVRAARARAQREELHRRQLDMQRQNLDALHGAADQHAIISMTDVAGRITYVNDKFCELSGFSREELLGSTHGMIKSSRHSAEFYVDLWRTITRGGTWHGEVCNRKKNGEIYWVSATIMPVVDSRGKPARYVSIRTEITLLKQTQDELLFSRQKARNDAKQVRAIFDNLPAGIFWKDRELRYRGANRHFLDDFGIESLAQLDGMSDSDLLPPAIVEIQRERSLKVLESGQPLPPFDELMELSDGKRWLTFGLMPQIDANGKVDGLLGVYFDITDLKTLKLELQESTERYKFFADNVEEGIVVCDQGIIVDVSDRWLQLFRCRRGDAVGQPLMSFIAASVVPMALQLIETKWAEPYESVMMRHDGTTFPAIVRGRNLEFGDRELRLTTVLDISRQKENELAVQATKLEAERANQAKTEFLSSMSHELRTPMNAIFGFAQILEFDERLDKDQQDSVHEILKAARHLLGLIDEVLDLAKIESGRMTLSIETVVLGPIVEECEQLLRPLANDRQISLCMPAGLACAVQADRVRLKQVLLNLLSNAIKYNQLQGEVRLSVEVGGPRVRIMVADTGRGIAPEDLSRLFQPFNRLDAEHSRIEGTGIGLVISRRLVEAMGGTIEVNSTPGQGSCFWFELPQADPERAAIHAQELPRGIKSEEQNQDHILYIDDNPVNLKLVTQMLGKLRNILLVTAHTPELGIELAQSRKPCLILLDINMPRMDGYEVLQVLKAGLQLRHVPVIAVSANAMPRDIERGIAAGFADYLTKPIDVGRFLESVDRHRLKGEHA